MTAPVPDDPPPLERLQTAFRADRTSDDPAADLRALVFVLDAQEALPSFQRLRDWALERLAPAPGETAVDVGCGAGTVVRPLAGGLGPPGPGGGVGARRWGGGRRAERRAAPARGRTFRGTLSGPDVRRRQRVRAAVR